MMANILVTLFLRSAIHTHTKCIWRIMATFIFLWGERLGLCNTTQHPIYLPRLVPNTFKLSCQTPGNLNKIIFPNSKLIDITMDNFNTTYRCSQLSSHFLSRYFQTQFQLLHTLAAKILQMAVLSGLNTSTHLFISQSTNDRNFLH